MRGSRSGHMTAMDGGNAENVIDMDGEMLENAGAVSSQEQFSVCLPCHL